jgi:hypothetical protein
VGFTEDAPRKELREASIVHADRIVKLWRDLGETALVVNTLDDMSFFFAFGGNAVIEQEVARSVIGGWLAPTVVAHVGQHGFTAVEALPAGALNKAPTPKHRMRILKRDNFRCRICGRSANDYVDLELHVHHIRPWVAGGVTDDSNLITLCHTCHNGLDPHYEFSLYSLLPGSTLDQRRAEYWDSLDIPPPSVAVGFRVRRSL